MRSPRDREVAVTLGEEDWKAIVVCLLRHSNASVASESAVGLVGRERLRYIAAIIRATIDSKAKP